MVIRRLYKRICELPPLAKLPVILAMAGGLSWAGANLLMKLHDYTMQSGSLDPYFLSEASVAPPEKPATLEEAVGKTLSRIETCGSGDDDPAKYHSWTSNNDQYLIRGCMDSHGFSSVSVRRAEAAPANHDDMVLALDCLGNGCPESVTLTHGEYVPGHHTFYDYKIVTKTFQGVDFRFREYRLHDVLPTGSVKVITEDQTGRRYGFLMTPTPTLQAAVDQARQRLGAL